MKHPDLLAGTMLGPVGEPTLIVDNFAGGGGASEGIGRAIGRPVDVAINHDAEAIAMHIANHPATRHYVRSIYAVDPLEATDGRAVLGAWFSPDCKHFSKAKGGKPVEKNIRDLAWIVHHWVKRLGPDRQPRIIWLENVEEFRTWGPLGPDSKPCPRRKGETFQAWVGQLRKAGYKVEWRELRACDYGAPTSRKRLFVIARCDGLPITWPEPTHGKPRSPEVLSGQRQPWRTAAEIIDWSIPCPSIFERKRPLKEATCRRIAAGIMRYVVNNPRPFIVPITHGGQSDRVHSVDEPLRTVTTAHRGEMAVVAPVLSPFYGEKRDGEREGQEPRARSVEQPFTTVTAKGSQGAMVAAFLHKYRPNSAGQRVDDPMPTVTANSFIKRPGGAPPLAVVCAHIEQANTGMVGHSPEKPLSTIVGKGCTQRVIASSLVKLRGTSKNGQKVDEPLHTISAGGGKGGVHFAEVSAFLVKYYGAHRHGQRADQPLDSVTSKARFGLVTVTIGGEEYVIVDIGMRMLTPRELASAQGFPPTYILDPLVLTKDKRGQLKSKPLTKTAQIRMIGNSVCPQLAEAIVRANLPLPSRGESPSPLAGEGWGEGLAA